MEDFNINEFAKMFDAALASDNPTVKKALRNFMLVAAIVTAEETDPRPAGPFLELINEIKRLSAKISVLENQIYRTTVTSQPATPYDPSRYTGINPTWVYHPTTSISSVSSSAGTASSTNAVVSYELSELLNMMDKDGNKFNKYSE